MESGSRYLLEGLIPGLRDSFPDAPIDLVTCYPGLPAGFPPETTVYRVADYRAQARRLLGDLRAGGPTIVGVVCSAEPIMTKWKWWVVIGLPAKAFILNENGDYFWIDWGHWSAIRHFVLFRCGLAGAGAVRTLSRLFLFPFTLLYLVMFAAWAHAGRLRRR